MVVIVANNEQETVGYAKLFWYGIIVRLLTLQNSSKAVFVGRLKLSD